MATVAPTQTRTSDAAPQRQAPLPDIERAPAGAQGHAGGVLGLQRAVGNRVVGGVLQRLSLVRAPVGLQAKLTINEPGDRFEQEADRVAEIVAGGGAAGAPTGSATGRGYGAAKDVSLQRLGSAGAVAGAGSQAAPPVVHDVLRSTGQPLDGSSRAFMEPRFGQDFGAVRVHTDARAAESARAVNAVAYTVGRDVVFGAGRYAPGTGEGRRLLAHELAHAVQQGAHQDHARTLPRSVVGEIRQLGPTVAIQSPLRSMAKPSTPSLQRSVELRPPGRGEHSAFDRKVELIDRLNKQSPAIQYTLLGQSLQYLVVDKSTLRSFDRKMIKFIDDKAVVPLRLITSAGRIGGQSVFVDTLEGGYLDLDDMMACDDLSFQMNVIHVLVERLKVPRYSERIGTGMGAEFNVAHRAGLDAETQHLKEEIGDPTISYKYEEAKSNNTVVFAFRSAEGYFVLHVFRKGASAVRGGELYVVTKDKRRLTIDQLKAERAKSTSPATTGTTTK